MLEQILNRIGQISERAEVKTVFGEPYRVNGLTVVPVAKVAYAFGFGAGRGTAKGRAAAAGAATGEDGGPAAGERLRGEGVGGGGGGRLSVRPVAVLEIGAAETKVRPIVDVTRIVVAALLLAAWNVFWITYSVRRIAGRRAAARD